MSSEQTRKRKENRYTVLTAIQSQGPLKRSALASRYGIRKSSITSLVDELIELDVLCNRDEGKPRSPLTYTKKKWFAIGVSVMPGEVVFARVDLAGEVLDKITIPIKSESYSGLKKTISEGVKKLLSVSPKKTIGIGVSLPGIVNSEEGVCICSINMPQIRDAKIGKDLRDEFGIDVVVENDVRASLWAGIWFERFLSLYQNAVYLDIADGVGSALLLEGKLHLGATYSAGELGHMRAGKEGRKCRCGKLDCLETYCSVTAIVKDIKSVAPEAGNLNSTEEIVDASDNVVVRNILERSIERLARLLSVPIAYVDPEAILLGNQDTRFYELILPMLRKHLSSRLEGCTSKEIDIKIVPDSEDSALKGVAGLVIERAFREFSLAK